MNGGSLLVQLLKDEGVDYVFGLPGTLDTAFRDALAGERDLKYILATHEFVAGTMADGYARASKRPSFANFHATSGPTFATGAIYNAYLDGVPVVFSSATVESRLIVQEQPYWPTDLTAFFRPITKWSHLVSIGDDILISLRRAFKVCGTRPEGPAFLAFPKDVLDSTCSAGQDKKSYAFSSIPRPSPPLVSAAASMLLSSKQPVMFVGDEVARYDAVDDTIELAELLALPVVTEAGFAYKSNSFPSENPLHLGLYHSSYTRKGSASDVANSADLLFGVGCKMFVERGEYPRTRRIPPQARVVQITSNPYEIAKNYPVDLGIVSDTSVCLRLLMEELKSRITKRHKAVIERRRKSILRIRETIERQRAEETKELYGATPITGLRLAKDMFECMARDAVLVNEGQAVASYFAHLQFKKEQTIFGQAGGALGWGLPASLGVKLAMPGRQVVAIVGDGCFSFSSQALWTARHYSIPTVTIICNNASYLGLKATTHEYHGLSVEKGVYVGCDLYEPHIDYVKLAESYGIGGERIERPGDLKPALKSALNSGEPAVLDVVLDPYDTGNGRARIPQASRVERAR